MPPCPITPAPSALYLPWPWQAPVNWLLFCLVLAVVAWLVVRGHRYRAKIAETSALAGEDGQSHRHPQPFWLRYIVFVFSPFISMVVPSFLLALVTFPSMQRNEAWYHGQFSRFASGDLNCSLSQSNLFTIAASHQLATLLTVKIAVGLYVVPWLLLLVVRYTVTWWRVWLVGR